MSTFDGNNHYFSGQGVVMIGDRDVNGRPKGLIPVGNVSALKLGLATTVLEHKESQSGAHAVDLRLITEIKSSLSMTVENFSSDSLARALAGEVTVKPGATVTDEDIGGIYLGRVAAFKYIKASTVTVKRSSGTPQAMTLYTISSTPWDYLLNQDAGSVKFNDGLLLAFDKLTTGSSVTAPTTVTPGSTTVFTWAATPPASILATGVGGKLVVSGLAGADAALVNNIPGIITAIDTVAKTVTVAIDTSGKTITIGTPKVFSEGESGSATYTYAQQNVIDAMTQGMSEKYMRFEGLNTADGNLPVVVEVFRFIVDPLKELALIGEGIGPFQLDGNTLADN